jgi:branched-chain amino acid transport system substrate-binding protein
VRLLVATRSAGKQAEARRILEAAGIEVAFPDDVNAWESPAEAALELHDSFQSNARAKAELEAKANAELTALRDEARSEIAAVKEAAATGFPMDHFIGNWWSASEADVIPAGDGAKGYKGATFHAPGTNFKVHADIVKYVYDKGKNIGPKDKIGEALYNRGVVNAMYMTEVFRTAMAKYGNKPLTTEQVRWGYEHFNLTDARLDQIGLKGFTHAVKVTCEDHEGSGPVLIQQWDGKKWNVVSDWIQPMREVVRPKLEAAAVEEGKKLGYTMRDCSKEN